MKIDRTLLSEFLLAGMIVIALTLLLNPFNILMTSAFVLTLIMLLAITLISFAVFVWREQPRDEREALHSLYAGRVSYFAGGAVLVLAITIQSFQHSLDPWLPMALGSMVIAKLVVNIWLRRK